MSCTYREIFYLILYASFSSEPLQRTVRDKNVNTIDDQSSPVAATNFYYEKIPGRGSITRKQKTVRSRFAFETTRLLVQLKSAEYVARIRHRIVSLKWCDLYAGHKTVALRAAKG